VFSGLCPPSGTLKNLQLGKEQAQFPKGRVFISGHKAMGEVQK
jgi:hypothetical protein